MSKITVTSVKPKENLRITFATGSVRMTQAVVIEPRALTVFDASSVNGLATISVYEDFEDGSYAYEYIDAEGEQIFLAVKIATKQGSYTSQTFMD